MHAALPAISAASPQSLPDPLSPRVLVVYVSNDADSERVANYYATKRLTPPANLCPITLSDPTTTSLAYADYVLSIQIPVRNCLTSIGRDQVLYIVLAYVRPYDVIGTNSLVYAVDSYVADIWDQYATTDFNPYPDTPHPYYADAQSQGNVYAPYEPLSVYRGRPTAIPIYSVWRLDGATPEVAQALVDNALAASDQGVSGQACIDRMSGPIAPQSDAEYGQGEWDLHRAAEFLARAGYAVIEDDHQEEFGTSPAPLTCPDALFYSGWYSYGTYNDVFTWSVGAIGFHLDSYSIAWSTAAVQRGVTATSGAVAEPYLEGLPRPGGLYRNLLEGANVGDAFLRNTRWLKWMNVNIGDPLYRPFPGGAPGFNPPPPENSFRVSARDVSGGSVINGTITLASPAPEGGVTFILSADHPEAVAIPDTVTVLPGSTSVTFPIASNSVATSVDCVLSANGFVNLSNTVTVSIR